MSTSTEVIEQLANTEYKYGFVTDIEQDIAPKGLNEDIVRLISAKKDEPEWLLEWRLRAYRAWLKMTEPTWQNVTYDRGGLPGRSPTTRRRRRRRSSTAWTKWTPRSGPPSTSWAFR